VTGQQATAAAKNAGLQARPASHIQQKHDDQTKQAETPPDQTRSRRIGKEIPTMKIARLLSFSFLVLAVVLVV
jgi:hypothetical protein